MRINKETKKFLEFIKEVFFFLLAIGIFLYSGYKIALYIGILKTDISLLHLNF